MEKALRTGSVLIVGDKLKDMKRKRAINESGYERMGDNNYYSAFHKIDDTCR